MIKLALSLSLLLPTSLTSECTTDVTKVQISTPDYRYIIPHKYLVPVMHYAAESQIPLWIATRLAYEESQWRENAVGRNKNGTFDFGLYQLNSAFLDDFATRFNHGSKIDPLDPVTNIRIAMRCLANLHNSYGTWRRTIIAWNHGSFKRIPQDTLDLARRVCE